jgi:hypothetical protein
VWEETRREFIVSNAGADNFVRVAKGGTKEIWEEETKE